MSNIEWKNFAGQERIKNVLESALHNDTLGHAYLFCGTSGTGKFAAAIEMAMAVLCTDTQNRPCYKCESCRKILHYSHPNLHIIMPMVLEKEHKSGDNITEAGWDYLSNSIRERISDPYRYRDFSGIPSIPVDWVRELNHAIQRGAPEGNRNIAIIDGIDVMTKSSANAMLKTLEEPPPGTLMLLLTERIQTVLPTIVSRCQILRFAYLSAELIRSKLAERFSIDPKDSRLDELVYSGSLGQAIYLYNNSDADVLKNALEFFNRCVSCNWIAVYEFIDILSANNNENTYEKLYFQIIRLIRNAYFKNIEGTENYIIGDSSLKLESNWINSPELVEQLVELCENSIKQIRSRVNISMVLVNYANAVMEIINEQK